MILRNLSKTLFILAVAYYVFHFLFFWVFESTDSYFYWAFANFIKTGQYFAPPPYNYGVPSTMEPPLYSVFLFFAQIFPRADIIIHFVQVLGIVLSGFLLYKIFRDFTKNETALLLASVFLLVPAHTIYTSNLVAEPIAVFFITLYLYLLHKIMNRNRIDLAPFLLVLSSVMVLQRYNLIVFYGFALIINLLFPISLRAQRNGEERKGSRAGFLVFLTSDTAVDPPHTGSPHAYPSARKTTKTLQRQIRNGVFSFIISIVVLLTWILINNRLNGSWGFSNAEGKHLYNRILHFDRVLPPNNDPSFVKFKSIVGEGIDYFKPWWFYEPQLIAQLGNETEASKLMGEVAIAALKTNPIKYILDTPAFFLFAHDSNPTYNDPLYLYNGKMKENCRSLGSIQFCKPVFDTQFAYGLWDFLVKATDWYYLNLSRWVNYLLVFPSIIFAGARGNKFIKYVVFLYLASILFFVMAEAPLPRYTYIFTSLKTILIGYFLINLVKLYGKRS